MRMSFPRAREVGKVPHFAFKPVFPAMVALRRVKLSKNNEPKMHRVTGVSGPSIIVTVGDANLLSPQPRTPTCLCPWARRKDYFKMAAAASQPIC